MPISDIDKEDMIRMLHGQITNWSEIGGPNLKVEIVRVRPFDSRGRAAYNGRVGLMLNKGGADQAKVFALSEIFHDYHKAAAEVSRSDGVLGIGIRGSAAQDLKPVSISGLFASPDKHQPNYPFQFDSWISFRTNIAGNHVKSFVEEIQSRKATDREVWSKYFNS